MKFVSVCDCSLGGDFTAIYSFLNVDCIVRIEIDNYGLYLKPYVYTSSGERFLVRYRSDLVYLLGEDIVKEFEDGLHKS